MSPASFDPLEQEFRRLRPVPVNPRLARAIEAQLAEPPPPVINGTPVVPLSGMTETPLRRLRHWLWLSWGVAAAAAVVALAALLREPPASGFAAPMVPQAAQSTPATAAPNASSDDHALRVVPVRATGFLYGARDEGLVRFDDGMTARQVRLQFVDTFQLAASEGGGMVNISYPREEIRVIPITTL